MSRRPTAVASGSAILAAPNDARYIRRCGACDAYFYPRSARAVACSAPCRQRLYRATLAAQQAQHAAARAKPARRRERRRR